MRLLLLRGRDSARPYIKRELAPGFRRRTGRRPAPVTPSCLVGVHLPTVGLCIHRLPSCPGLRGGLNFLHTRGPSFAARGSVARFTLTSALTSTAARIVPTDM